MNGLRKASDTRICVFAAMALILATAVLAACGKAPDAAGDDDSMSALASPAPLDFPALAERRQRIAQALQGDGLIRLDAQTLSGEAMRAQALAIARPEFMADLRGADGAPLLGEIFAVYALRPSEQRSVLQACERRTCWRVEKYNYARNLATVAFVAIEGDGEVLAMQNLTHAAPDVPPALGELASEIARHSPEVRNALGYTPETGAALMAATRTSLNRSRCERSRHLCVAPTFVVGERALWAIVDLTELKLVGVRWTEVGAHVASSWTEKKLQNEVLVRDYCERSHHLDRAGWSLDYVLTTSDGLKISSVSFNGKPVLSDAKLVDWHVSYSKSEGFGYSDAVGCPSFSQAAVLAVEPPKVLPLHGADGFALVQGYWSDGWPTPCNYNYEQRYEFHADGSFRVVVASLGRGCGDDGTYRPVTRIAFASPQAVAQYDGNVWKPMPAEGWLQQSAATTAADGALLQIGDWSLIPSAGQFGDGGRGDHAYVYVTRPSTAGDEGEGDLPTIGPCCNSDYRQGPERFIDTPPEALAAVAPVLWYVAQLKNDGRPGQEYCWADTVVQDGDFVEKVHACPSGPLFRPRSAAVGAANGAP